MYLLVEVLLVHVGLHVLVLVVPVLYVLVASREYILYVVRVTCVPWPGSSRAEQRPAEQEQITNAGSIAACDVFCSSTFVTAHDA